MNRASSNEPCTGPAAWQGTCTGGRLPRSTPSSSRPWHDIWWSGLSSQQGVGHNRQVSDTEKQITPYEQFGGHEFFAKLVARFYQGVRQDSVLAPMYPAHEFDEAERRLLMFMEQYWGGPQTYGEERGHPRLRMRHMEFAIDAEARDRWLTHMHDAIIEMNMQDAELENQLWMYLVGAAHAMQNIDDTSSNG